MPVFCCSFVPCSSGTPWGEGKGQAAVKVEQVLHFPAPGMQHCPSTPPSVLGGVCSVTVKGQLGFQVLLLLGAERKQRCVITAELPGKAKGARAGWLPGCSPCVCSSTCWEGSPMGRTKCTGVGYTWEPLAVLLPGEGGPRATAGPGASSRLISASQSSSHRKCTLPFSVREL